MRAVIPNIFTGTNLFCGMLALVFVATDQVWAATIALFVAGFMDFFDGFVARMLNVSSEIGKELDSLADNVTFGAVPGFVMARLIQESQGLNFLPDQWGNPMTNYLWMVAFLVPIFSAVRLARFNLDTRQSDAFYGVPTPANTMILFSLWVIVDQYQESWFAPYLQQTWLLVIICLLSCWWLNMDVRLIALKFKGSGLKDNLFRYLIIFVAIGGLILFQFVAVPVIFALYLIFSFIENWQLGKQGDE
ncbi:MAG: CDP-alcohol phosphatidyltransferase family protein [Bacteroidota bacterium]